MPRYGAASRPGDGELIEAARVEHLFRRTAARTGGRFGFEEFTLTSEILSARSSVHQAHDEMLDESGER